MPLIFINFFPSFNCPLPLISHQWSLGCFLPRWWTVEIPVAQMGRLIAGPFLALLEGQDTNLLYAEIGILFGPVSLVQILGTSHPCSCSQYWNSSVPAKLVWVCTHVHPMEYFPCSPSTFHDIKSFPFLRAPRHSPQIPFRFLRCTPFLFNSPTRQPTISV